MRRILDRIVTALAASIAGLRIAALVSAAKAYIAGSLLFRINEETGKDCKKAQRPISVNIDFFLSYLHCVFGFGWSDGVGFA